jgi:hypothetical protein
MIDVIRIDDASILAAFKLAEDAQRRADAAFEARWPPEATVSWVWGPTDAIQHGQVVRHGKGDRVEVRNVETDAVYWIHGWRVRATL